MNVKTKVDGPDFIALQWRDLDPGKRFYHETLGLALAPQSPPGAVVFATEHITFAVRTPLVNLDLTPHRGYGVALWFKVDDSAKLRDHLVDKGVEVTSDLVDGPFGKTFSIRDPEGYLITLHDCG